jgi:hypothetical protein
MMKEHLYAMVVYVLMRVVGGFMLIAGQFVASIFRVRLGLCCLFPRYTSVLVSPSYY